MPSFLQLGSSWGAKDLRGGGDVAFTKLLPSPNTLPQNTSLMPVSQSREKIKSFC